MHDLRSASVNNTRLAIVAAWHRLHPFLRYFSNRLFGEIAAFLDSVKLAKKGDVSAIRSDTLSRRMCMKQVMKLSWSCALLAGTAQANAARTKWRVLLLLKMPRPVVLTGRDPSSMWCRQICDVRGAMLLPICLTPGCWRLQFSVRNYRKGGDASVASHLSPWASEQPEEAAFSGGAEACPPAKRPHESSSSSRSHGDHSRDHCEHRSEKAEHRSSREDHQSSGRRDEHRSSREDHRGSGRRDEHRSSGRREDHPSSSRRDEHRSGQHEPHDRCLLSHACLKPSVRQLSYPVICWGTALGSDVESARLQNKTWSVD